MTLKELRENAGLRQSDVADKLEIDQSTVSKWEGGANPTKKYLPKLAKLYGCTVADIELA